MKSPVVIGIAVFTEFVNWNFNAFPVWCISSMVAFVMKDSLGDISGRKGTGDGEGLG